MIIPDSCPRLRLIVLSSLYTQAWDGSYATNVGQWRSGSHYTIDQSVAGVNITNSGDVSCPQDVPYLSSNGQAFCSAYISYIPPTVISTVNTVPATVTAISVLTSLISSTSYTTDIQTHNFVSTATVTTGGKKRDVAIQTPASISTWSPSRISAACSAVATGTASTTTSTTAATPILSLTSTTHQTIVTTDPSVLHNYLPRFQALLKHCPKH
jgi:hypothetical protein